MDEPVTSSQRPAHSDDRTPQSKPAWLWMIPVILLVGIFFVSRLNRSSTSGQAAMAIGKPAPQIDLVSLTTDSPQQSVQELASGNVTLIHFWGTWCGPCKMEYPHLSEMVSQLGSNPEFRFLSISCESGSNETLEGLARKTHDYLSQIGASTEVFADPYGITRTSAAERLQQPAMYFPTSILVDRQGTIRGVWQGYAPSAVNEMESTVKELLSDA